MTHLPAIQHIYIYTYTIIIHYIPNKSLHDAPSKTTPVNYSVANWSTKNATIATC